MSDDTRFSWRGNQFTWLEPHNLRSEPAGFYPDRHSLNPGWEARVLPRPNGRSVAFVAHLRFFQVTGGLTGKGNPEGHARGVGDSPEAALDAAVHEWVSCLDRIETK